jgi:predicted Zn-dependent protease
VTLQSKHFALLGILMGLVLVQACGRKLQPEPACNFVQNQNMQRVSWSHSLPVTIYLDSSVPLEFEPAIVSAVAKWNAVGQSVMNRDFFNIGSGSPGSSRIEQDGYSKIYFLNTWEANRPSEQARTTVYWMGSDIYESDMRVNHKNFDFFMSSRPDPAKVHLESLIIHELGHMLGLAHTAIAGSVMKVSLENGLDRSIIGQPDINSIQCEYK